MSVILCKGSKCPVKEKCERNYDLYLKFFSSVKSSIVLRPIVVSDFSLDAIKVVTDGDTTAVSCEAYIPNDWTEIVPNVEESK